MRRRVAEPTPSDVGHKLVRSKKAVSACAGNVPRLTQRMEAMTNFTVNTEAMTANELDSVSGGIIFVGGFQNRYALVHQASLLDKVAINPQPLPPRIFSFAH